ncbi:MAG TPA: sigma-70 family RNA polymerase sigma factor, partial [bacterium (Candidatus Stahlbacteria)]|nr:sigma-70 family RNA polymerase sigma factor [Candidatus Stahlbacteria bacterium]
FIHAFKAIDRFDKSRPLGPWLYRIAINLSINFIKKRDRYSVVSAEEVTLHSKGTRYNPVKHTEQKMLLEKVEETITQLPEDLKTILILRVNEEMSYDEIAQTLDISRGTVMSRLSRARAKLKELVFGRER